MSSTPPWPILFIGCLGWGVESSGIASGVSFLLATLVMLPLILRKESPVSLREGRISFRLLGRMVYNGSSEGLSELSAGIAVLLFNWTMMKLWGTAGVAAFTSVNYLLYLGVQLFVGLSDGIIPIFSFNYGAGRFSRVRETLYMGLKTNGVLGLTFFCIVFFGARSIIPLFFDANLTENVDDVLEIAYIGAGFCAFAFLMNGLNILSSSFFTSMGDAATSAIISLLRGLIMTTVGIVLYPVLFGHHGIWLVIPVAELVTLACCFFLVKKRLSLFETSKITA